MKVSYYLTPFLNKEKIYNKNFRYMDSLDLYVIEDLKIYNPSKRVENTIKSNQLIKLESMLNEENIKKGLYTLDYRNYNYRNFFISEEQLNAYTIPMYMKNHSYDKDYNYAMEGIEIRKKGSIFPVYRTPNLSNDAKKVHYVFVDAYLKKIFNNCGDIILNSSMNTILQNVNQFDKLFMETNNADLCVQIKKYLETMYNKMIETEYEKKKVKTAKDYFELNFSDLSENDFLNELKLKTQFLNML